MAPIWVGDVADAIAAADDAPELSGVTWSVAGPAELALDGLVDAVNGGRVATRHLAPGDGAARGRWGGTSGQAEPRARTAPWAGLGEVQIEVRAADSLGDPALPSPPGLVPTPLAEALARGADGAGRGLPGSLDG